jgi:uncharacterized protein
MKRAVVVHCWGGNSEYAWYPQSKRELEEKGFLVKVPDMPETEFPKLSGWLPKLKEEVGAPDIDLFLVGHSLGVITILKYLEDLREGQEIGGAVFVAGFSKDIGFEEIKNFFEIPVDFEKIKSHCKKFVAIHSDNDPYVDLKFGDIFKEKLGAKVIIKHNFGHFSGPIDNEESCTSLPEVAEEILNTEE